MFFSPLNYLIYFIFLNVLIRNIYIIYDYPSKNYIDSIFLLFQNKDILIKPILLTLCSFIFFIIGYLISFKTKFKSIKIQVWNLAKLNFLSFILLTISLLSFIYFIISSNFNFQLFALETLSAYRGVSNNLSEYNASGILRVLIQLSLIVFYINYIYYISYKKKFFLNKLFISVSFLISIFFFFFVQSRSGVIFIFINCFIISYYITSNKLSFKKISLLFVLIICLFSFMTSIRAGSGFDLDNALKNSIFTLLDPLVANNGGIDMSKTAHIMNYVDKNNDFKYGSGYIWIFTSFIPRSIWSNKPVNIDTEVGSKVYGALSFGTGAVPPGLIAESYWNLGYLGILFVPFLLGIFTRHIHTYFRYIDSNNNNKVLFYVVYFHEYSLLMFWK